MTTNKVLTFADRSSAGRLLASELSEYTQDPDAVVVALLRGGVPVGYEIAQQLRVPLDFLVVRKLGVPWRRELAMGAVATGGVRVLDDEMIHSLQLSKYYVYGLIAKEEKELGRREQFFRRNCPAQNLSRRTVILVDDGAATGSTVLAAKQAVEMHNPKDIIIAMPVASREACRTFEAGGSRCVCLSTPEPFVAVGQWYDSFPQLGDMEIEDVLSRSHLGAAETHLLAHAAGR